MKVIEAKKSSDIVDRELFENILKNLNRFKERELSSLIVKLKDSVKHLTEVSKDSQDDVYVSAVKALEVELNRAYKIDSVIDSFNLYYKKYFDSADVSYFDDFNDFYKTIIYNIKGLSIPLLNKELENKITPSLKKYIK